MNTVEAAQLHSATDAGIGCGAALEKKGSDYVCRYKKRDFGVTASYFYLFCSHVVKSRLAAIVFLLISFSIGSGRFFWSHNKSEGRGYPSCLSACRLAFGGGGFWAKARARQSSMSGESCR